MPDSASAASPTPDSSRPARRRQRGQVLAIFAVATIVFVGILAVVVDVSFYWASSLKVQRAADAAALAGVVWLPGDVAHGIAAANAAAAENGFPDGGTIDVTPNQDSQVVSNGNPRQMDVTITAPVNTFFMRMFGITKIQATRTSKAVYVLPVPMGSPLNYYGDFGPIYRTGNQTITTNDDTGGVAPTKNASGNLNQWTNGSRGFTPDGQFATSTSSGNDEGYYDYNYTFPNNTTILGLQVDLIAKASRTACTINVSLSQNGGGSFTSTKSTGTLTTAAAGAQYTLGSATDLWGRTWTSSQLSGTNNTNFVVDVADAGCTGGTSHTTSLDSVAVTIYYQYTATQPIPSGQLLTDPYGNPLAPQGFWATALSQGAESISGDAYLPYYDTATSSTNPNYSTTFYDYSVSFPAGSTNGEVWLYDPAFCGGDLSLGTGDGWYSGSGSVSTFYTLYDTKLTSDTSDDTVAASSGNLFKHEQASDDSVGGDGTGSDCAPGQVTDPSNGLYYHLKWWKMASGLVGGKVYRLHIATTDPSSASDQRNTNARNGFTIWANASGGTPSVYGNGAMETFEPLRGGGSEVFYLAQIDKNYAGKTMEINLWDPGDTGSLSASLKVLAPNPGAYVSVPFNWTAHKGTTNANASNCNSLKGTGVMSVTTNTGGNSLFNGCWVTIDIPLPTSYTAPQPVGETHGGGWWKIEYDMGGSSSDNATDITTWTVSLLGNPVHLVIP